RDEVIGRIDQKEARRILALDESRFTVFIVGGSQGARHLNEIVVESAAILKDSVQIIHQVGERNLDEVRSAYGSQPESSIRIHGTLTGREMAQSYRAANLVVCRCGIGTLSEVTVNGAPSIMVPLPTAYADHQTANARHIEKAGAGVLMPEPTLN